MHCARSPNSVPFPRPIYAGDWEEIVFEIGRERDFRTLYVAALMCAKECRYRAEDYGGEEWYYWTCGDFCVVR